MRTMFETLLFVGLAASAAAADEPVMATVAPPRTAQAKFDADQLHLVVTRWTLVPEVVTINERANGKIVSRQQVLYFWSPAQHPRSLKQHEYRVFTPDGKMLDADAIVRRFKQQIEVLVDETGHSIEDVYGRLLKPDTLIVVPSAPQARPVPDAAPEATTLFTPVEDPKGPPPRLALVHGEANSLVVVEAAWEEVIEMAVQEAVIKLPNGERRTCTSCQAVVRHVPAMRTSRVAEDDVRAVRRDGTLQVAPLPPRPILVLLHEAGTTFDPAHLKWYRDEVPVLQVKLGPPMVERLVADRPPPQLALAHVREGKIAIDRLETKAVVETVAGTLEVQRDGKTVTENVERQERSTTLSVSRVEWPLAEVKGTTVVGTEIAPAALAARLADETVVLESLDATSVGTAYRPLFKDETPVVWPANSSDPTAKPAAESVAKPSKSDPRRGVPPRIAFARLGGEYLVLRDLTVTPVLEKRAKVVNVNGQMQTVVYDHRNWTTNFEEQALRGENYTVFDVSGTKLTVDQVRIRLKGDVAVLVASDSKPVDGAYLAICKSDALIVYPRFPSIWPER